MAQYLVGGDSYHQSRHLSQRREEEKYSFVQCVLTNTDKISNTDFVWDIDIFALFVLRFIISSNSKLPVHSSASTTANLS